MILKIIYARVRIYTLRNKRTVGCGALVGHNPQPNNTRQTPSWFFDATTLLRRRDDASMIMRPLECRLQLLGAVGAPFVTTPCLPAKRRAR